MKLYWFIGKRVAFESQKTFSSFAIRLSLVATMISVAVMLLSLGILNGFKKSVNEKVFSFWGHIRVEPYMDNEPIYSEDKGIIRDRDAEDFLVRQKNVEFFTPYANKYGILLSEYSLEGVLFKGYSDSFSPKHFNPFMVKGRWLGSLATDSAALYEIVFSVSEANALKVDTGDFVIANFIQNNGLQRKRKLKVVGIYKTGMDIYDKNFTFVHLSLIQKLNAWPSDKIGGYEVFLKDIKNLSQTTETFFENLPSKWQAHSSVDIFPAIFDWLSLLDVNEYIVLIIMFIVAIMNMITCMVTLVLDRMFMIGILKTIGASNWEVQKIFLYYASFIALLGLLLGNILGIGIGILQNCYGFFTLSEQSYFIEKVKIHFELLPVLFLNIGVFLLCFAILIIPTFIIHKQKIIHSLRF